MKSINELFVASEYQQIWRIVIASVLIWSGLRFLCWILGAVGLGTAGKRRQCHPAFMAWVPFGQLWYEIRLTHHRNRAQRAVPFLVGMAILFSAMLMALFLMMRGGESEKRMIFIIAAVAAAAGILYCGIRLRILEFQALRDYMGNDVIWLWSLLFTIIGIPVQRIFFYANRRELD